MSKKLKTYSEVQNKLHHIFPDKTPLGADPEIFLTKNGRVIGSEKVITENASIVEDGIQVELHPVPDTCREILGRQVKYCLDVLKSQMSGKGCKVSPAVTVKVSKRHYNTLSEKNKQFGCNPSECAYNLPPVPSLDPALYLNRSGGGHMHFGRRNGFEQTNAIIDNPNRLIPILDILVGNTLVLLDRDKGNVERRKYYGRAGEYRIQPHGVEYRTPSNFWLNNEALLSLAFGLGRQAIAVCRTGLDKILLKMVDQDDIIKAINSNDYELAFSNWNKYKDFLVHISSADSTAPINSKIALDVFERVAKEGINNWFYDDIFKNWEPSKGKRGGWRAFTGRVIAEEGAKIRKQSDKKQNGATTCGATGQASTLTTSCN